MINVEWLMVNVEHKKIWILMNDNLYVIANAKCAQYCIIINN
jgi:hypothetical protein